MNTPTAADLEAARRAFSDFTCTEVGDSLHVTRLARLLATQRAAGYAAGYEQGHADAALEALEVTT